MGHYLLPLQDVLSGEGLLSAIRLIHAERLRRGEFGEAFWSEWVERMRFGWRELVQLEPGAEATPRSPSVLAHAATHIVAGLEGRHVSGARLGIRCPPQQSGQRRDRGEW